MQWIRSPLMRLALFGVALHSPHPPQMPETPPFVPESLPSAREEDDEEEDDFLLGVRPAKRPGVRKADDASQRRHGLLLAWQAILRVDLELSQVGKQLAAVETPFEEAEVLRLSLFDKAVKLGKVFWNACNQEGWLNLQDFLNKWVAKGFASNVKD